LLERACWEGSCLEETSSIDEEELSSSPLSLLLSPNARQFFDVTVESFASSSLAYLRLFCVEAIGVAK
jgi:hypothetical protein